MTSQSFARSSRPLRLEVELGERNEMVNQTRVCVEGRTFKVIIVCIVVYVFVDDLLTEAPSGVSYPKSLLEVPAAIHMELSHRTSSTLPWQWLGGCVWYVDVLVRTVNRKYYISISAALLCLTPL